MKMDDLVKQADTSMQAIGRIVLITGQLIARPSQFFWERSRDPEARRREANGLLAFSVAWLAWLYYLVVASVRPVKSLEVYCFASVVFNVANLVCMAGIYALLARLACSRVPFRLHLWNVLCTTPILCLTALLTQDHSEAWTRQQVEGTAVELGGLAAAGPWLVLLGYAWIARLVYASLRHNVGVGWFKAALVSCAGFALTLLFVAFPLTSGYVRLLKVLTA
jgi:hypothetical protein